MTDDEIMELAKRYKNDSSLRDTIIMELLPLATAQAAKYSKAFRLDFEDLQGEGFLAVVDAVNRFPDISHNNISGYVTKYIKQYCHRYCVKFSPMPSFIEGTMTDGTDFTNNIIAEEIVDRIAKKPIEKKIIVLRLKGYNDSKIGEMLNINRKTVWSIRHTLSQRFRRLSNV